MTFGCSVNKLQQTATTSVGSGEANHRNREGAEYG